MFERRAVESFCWLAVVLVIAAAAARADADVKVTTVGRVRINPVAQAETDLLARAETALREALATASGASLRDVRLLSLRSRPGDPTRFDATIYDYGTQQTFELVVDETGRELSRAPSSAPPSGATPDEIEEAKAIVARDPSWARAILEGSRTLYEAMPQITVHSTGRRLVNVGVMAAMAGSRELLANEVVSVDIPGRRLVRYSSAAPPTSSAALLTCNPPPEAGCGAPIGACGTYHVEWPSPNPVWKLNLRHPACTTSVQPDGTGLEVTNVFYKDELILQRAEVPVLNVKYDAGCGPFRDVLFFEDCFTATGTTVAPGVVVTSGLAPPTTFCESDPPSDAGNFNGVAIHDQGDALWLVTETNAGWYRYIMEYRFHLDGTIEPIFGFGGVANGCTCLVHTHHAYWRFEWAIGGVSGDPATGINTLERLSTSVPGQLDPITVESKFIRPRTTPQNDVLRIRSPQTGTEYLIKPSVFDGSAFGDAYAKADVWALAQSAFEINDPNQSVDTTIAVDFWRNGEPLGASKRLTLWYRVGYKHDANFEDEVCELTGPKLLPVPSCLGEIVFDRKLYGCSDGIGLRLDELDLAGAGTASITLASTTETTAETVVLTESPTKPGRFTGVFPSTTSAPVSGDGRISVTASDVLTARYVDPSACGTPNVAVVRTATIDCAPPTLTNIVVNSVTTLPVVSWSTNEPATSVVHYGPPASGSSTASDAALVTTHQVSLAQLGECAPYVYDVQSFDQATNPSANPAGSFTSSQARTYASAGGPVEIPNYDQTGVTSTVFVPETKLVEDVEVEVNITHTADYNLLITLTSPDGATTVTLSQYRGDIGHNFTHTFFDDESFTPVSTGVAPFTGRFRPDGVLGSFDGLNAHGAWILKIVDIDQQGLGTLDSWSLILRESCPPHSVPPPVPDGSFGSAMRAVRSNAAGSSIQVTWDAATCPAPGYHLLYGPLGTVSTYAVSGAKCALGATGTAAWTGVPAGSLWFVVAGENDAGMEGSWGANSSGGSVGGSAPSGLCGATSRLNTPACP